MKKISARRDGISFLAEAHEMEHLGAEKTARRLWDLGFDWLGLSIPGLRSDHERQ